MTFIPRLKKLTACFLLLACLCCLLSGCGKISTELFDTANSKVSEYLGSYLVRDLDAMYSTLYPGQIDELPFRNGVKSSYSYFPLQPGYTLDIIEWQQHSRVGSDEKSVAIAYKLATEGQLFYISVNYYSTSQGQGFTSFKIINEADFKEATGSDLSSVPLLRQ